MPRLSPRAVVVAMSASLWAGAAAQPAAQTSNYVSSATDTTQPRSGGWTFTPALGFASSWDDNVLMKANGDEPVGAYVNALNPRFTADYNGRRTQVNASYDGSFLMYHDFNSLNSYDQRAFFSARHLVNRRVTLFASNSAAFVPTTELVAFVGVPFVRTGSQIEDAHAGVDIALSKHSSMTASYNFQWVSFNSTAEFANVLRGGHNQGATLGWKRAVSDSLSLTADYEFQRATVTERVAGNPVGDFNIHNGWVGVEARLSPTLHAFAAGGIARVGVSAFGPPKTGPAWRSGLTYQRRKTGVDLSYSRSFVPSYSFGGTIQNEDLTTRLRQVFSRRLSGQASFSWRSNQALTPNEPDLRSLWLEGTLGYNVQNWLRVEGFFVRSRQSIDRPGGLLDRNRVGFQIVTSNPVRIR
jgi:hypothetical protein